MTSSTRWGRTSRWSRTRRPRSTRTPSHRAFEAATRRDRAHRALMTTWRPDSEMSASTPPPERRPVAVSPETFDVVAASIHTSEISEGTSTSRSRACTASGSSTRTRSAPADRRRRSKRSCRSSATTTSTSTRAADRSSSTSAGEQDRPRRNREGVRGRQGRPKCSARRDRGLLRAGRGGPLHAGPKAGRKAVVRRRARPRGREGSYFAMLDVTDHAFSTAGDYERSYIVGGKRYHHIIDPRTGTPRPPAAASHLGAPPRSSRTSSTTPSSSSAPRRVSRWSSRRWRGGNHRRREQQGVGQQAAQGEARDYSPPTDAPQTYAAKREATRARAAARSSRASAPRRRGCTSAHTPYIALSPSLQLPRASGHSQ